MDLNPQLFNEVVQPTQADYPAMSRVISRCLREVNSRDYPSEVINKLVDLYSPDNLAQVLEGSFCIVVRRRGELIGTGGSYWNRNKDSLCASALAKEWHRKNDYAGP